MVKHSFLAIAGVAAALISATIVVQALCFLVGVQFGEAGLFVSYIAVVGAAWFAGRRWDKKYWWAGAICAAVFGYAYCRLDWQLVTWWVTNVLQHPPEVLRWRAGIFALLAWPVSVLCGVAASVASMVPERRV